MDRTCHQCHGASFHYQQANLKRCSGCQGVYYCSTACQEYDWVEHIFDCNPSRPINTADHLARAVRQDLIPSDPQTRRDYGFDRTVTVDEEGNLLGLYIGLIKIMGISPKKMHNWRVGGVLVDKIKAEYYKYPEDSRGFYFLWFLENEHVIAQAGQPLSENDSTDAALVRAWRFIGRSERESAEEIEAAFEHGPVEEKYCFWLYVLLLARCPITPDVDLWVAFGFAACLSRAEEIRLRAAYDQLITICTFKELCDAHRTHRILNLFRSKGLQVDEHVQIQDLLCTWSMKSVWHLKRRILQEDSLENYRMRPAVMVDYGFTNCWTAAEWWELKRVYRAFFDSPLGDPFELDDAAMEQDIHACVSTVVPGIRNSKYRRLMRNPHVGFFPVDFTA